MRSYLLVGCLISFLSISADLRAAEQPSQWLGGADVSPGNSYLYLGQVVPLSGNTFGNGLVRRVWLDWSKYRYEKGGQTYEVSAPGAEIALGYQQASESHWWASYIGLAYRNSVISPDDLESSIRGGMLKPKFQIEGEQTSSEGWKLGANGSYIAGQRAYWARGRVTKELPSNLQIGLEAIVQGDPSYRLNQLGVVLLGLKAGNMLDVGLKLGARQVEGLGAHAYLGIELGRMY